MQPLGRVTAPLPWSYCVNAAQLLLVQVGTFLKRYKSGKLPKVFKLLPGLTNWEDLLFITRPEEWSANAVYAATRVFASNLSAAMAQRCASRARRVCVVCLSACVVRSCVLFVSVSVSV